jgi:hypothetical protein
MLHSLLFPYNARYVGWLIFIPAALLGIATLNFDFILDFLTVPLPEFFITSDPLAGLTVKKEPPVINLTNELAAIGSLIGLFLIAFSRERIEDEFISRMRLEALQWSVVVNYAILALLIILAHGLEFILVLSYNMFTLLIVFVARMRWLMYRHNHQLLTL